MDIIDEDTPLSQIQSKIKKRKTHESQSHATEASTDLGKDQGLDTPDSKKKKKKKKKVNTITDIEPVEQPVEETPIKSKERTPEKSQSSSKLPTEIVGKDPISHTWFNVFSTYGKWLDGFASFPIGFCSAISPSLLVKLKDADCL